MTVEKIATKKLEEANTKLPPPKMFVAQVYLGHGLDVCMTAAANATHQLRSYAAFGVIESIQIIAAYTGKCDYLNLSKPMPKDIADQLYPAAVQAATEGRLMCECGKGFALRLEEN